MSAAPLVVGLALALTGSLALNGSYVVQHLGAVSAPAVDVRRPLASVRGLLGSRLWLLGGALGIGGWLLHVGALSQAPLSLAQAFSAGGLALSVPVAARLTRRPLDRAGRRGVAVMSVALAGLALGARPVSGGHVGAAALVAFVAAGAVAAAGIVVRGRGPRALGLAAGVLYGVGDVATKAATGLLGGGLLGALLSPWAVVLAGTSATAFFCLQRGLQIGQVVAVIALMTAATNVVAMLGGIVAFGEPLGATVPIAVGHAVALVAVVVAGWWLAPAQARLMER